MPILKAISSLQEIFLWESNISVGVGFLFRGGDSLSFLSIDFYAKCLDELFSCQTLVLLMSYAVPQTE
jgi:hypothetical protein